MNQYIVDAFTDKIFCGNPAAVCILKNFPEEKIMLNIAKENNLSETAFAVKEKNFYNLRWFTPSTEIDFCGHATLATAYVILNFIEPELNLVNFKTLRGDFSVKKNKNLIEMDFPSYEYKKISVTDEMSEAIGEKVLEAYLSRDLLLVIDSDEKVKNLRPNLEKLQNLEGLIQAVTAKSSDENFDCISRVFAPKVKVSEDPVTGSTHCLIAPYWSKILNKNILKCYQASERGGILQCEIIDDRVKISGNAILFAKSKLNIEE